MFYNMEPIKDVEKVSNLSKLCGNRGKIFPVILIQAKEIICTFTEGIRCNHKPSKAVRSHYT